VTNTPKRLIQLLLYKQLKTGLNIYELRQQVAATQAIAAADTQRYNAILEGLPKIELTPDKLRALIGRFEALQKRTPALEPLLTHLSLALNDSPRIELSRLTWKIVDQLDVGAKPLPDPKRSASAAPAGTRGWVTIEIQAQLPLGLVTDQRAQIELIESFAARLRGPQTDVKILSRPFDIESDKPLRSAGETGGLQAADVPKFSLRIARLM